MDRWARALPSALALLALTAAATLAAGPPFPDPVNDQSVYDTADVLSPETEAELEAIIDGVEADTGAELVVYTQLDPGISEDENLGNAKALIDQWGVGRSGFDDGAVLMVGLEENRVNGRVSLFGGSGFIGAYASESELKGIIDDDFVPSALMGDMNGAAL
ncbi:MAG: TPM domain-containing protein, partial [Candidatus Limnocylindria bacterium]